MNNLLICVVSFCALISQVLSQENPTIFELTDDSKTVSWIPTSTETIEVHAEYGYQIQIDVSQFYVDGESDDSVTVKSITDDGEETDQIIFTYAVSGKPRYLYNSNKVKAEYIGTNTSNNFVLKFTRAGEQVTTSTIIPTTTEEPMPTPAPDEEATLTVYLYGLPAGSFGPAEIKNLREAIAKMGIEYCDIQNCPLGETITYKNVKIEMLQQCSVMWEDYDACIILTFALPIVKSEEYEVATMWQGYQLSESHLRILWDQYGAKYMGQIGLSLYPVPDLNVIFKYRIIIISLVIAMLIILVLSVRHLAGKLHRKRRRLSDTISILDRPSDRISQQSLPPHYLQELPPHFVRSHIASYPEYNMAFVEDEDKSIPQPVGNQITIPSDVNDLMDADA